MNDSPRTAPAQNAPDSLTVQPDEILVDARGHHCPVPSLRLQKALAAAPGRRVRLLADDPMARIDVPHLLQSKGYPPPRILNEENWLIFLVEPAA